MQEGHCFWWLYKHFSVSILLWVFLVLVLSATKFNVFDFVSLVIHGYGCWVFQLGSVGHCV